MLVLRHKAAKLAFRLICVFIGVYVIFLLIVPLLGPGWHLLHGDFIFLDGWKVPVPKGFYVTKDQENRAMWKPTLGTPLLKVPYGHISLYHLRPPQQSFVFNRDYTRFRKATTQEAIRDRYELKSESTLSVGNTSGYCLQFTRLAGDSRSLIRCAVEDGLFFVFYEGDPRYVPNFFGVLRGMSLENTKAGRAD